MIKFENFIKSRPYKVIQYFFFSFRLPAALFLMETFIGPFPPEGIRFLLNEVSFVKRFKLLMFKLKLRMTIKPTVIHLFFKSLTL